MAAIDNFMGAKPLHILFDRGFSAIPVVADVWLTCLCTETKVEIEHCEFYQVTIQTATPHYIMAMHAPLFLSQIHTLISSHLIVTSGPILKPEGSWMFSKVLFRCT